MKSPIESPNSERAATIWAWAIISCGQAQFSFLFCILCVYIYIYFFFGEKRAYIHLFGNAVYKTHRYVTWFMLVMETGPNGLPFINYVLIRGVF